MRSMQFFSRGAVLRRFMFLVVSLGLLSSAAWAGSAFRDMAGNITTLENQQTPGKWTVVMIWASDCAICNKEVGAYSKFYLEHIDNDAKMVGISIDGREGRQDAKDFVERNSVVFPSLIAEVDTVARWYQMQTGSPFLATPSFVLIDGEGEVRAAQVGAVPTDIIENFIASKAGS